MKITASALVLWAAALCVVPLMPSCGTPVGNTAANIITSPAVETIVSLAVQAGESALFAQTGQKLSPEGESALSAAVTPLVNTATAAGLADIAKALRGKQTTVAAADSGKLVAAITSTGATVKTAVPIAEAVPVIVNTSGGTVTPEAANVAVQAAINSIAAGK